MDTTARRALAPLVLQGDRTALDAWAELDRKQTHLPGITRTPPIGARELSPPI